MAKKIPSVAAILSAGLQRKQKSQPSGYSLRALARDLGVSPAFVSKMMNGQKLPPRERLEKISYILELDLPEKEALIQAVMLDPFGAKVLTLSPAKKAAAPAKRATSQASNKLFLSSWINLAVLEGLQLEPPHNDLDSLRRRLGISPAEAKRALDTLIAADLVEQKEGEWRKRDQHLYVSGGRSREEVRAFHEKMMNKAIAEMKTKTAQGEYERRLINGFTFALNPEHLDRLKAKILNFLDEVSQEASEGECMEVYQLSFQFFPLTGRG